MGSKTFSHFIPESHLRKDQSRPAFWVNGPEEIDACVRRILSKGTWETIGKSAGGRDIKAYFLGEPRRHKPTTTGSGAYGAYNMEALMGSDPDFRVFVSIAGVHGSEFEGIVQAINMISILETGKDLRGKPWPEISKLAGEIRRIIIIPIMNVDGRARLPFFIEPYMGTSGKVHQYLTLGAWMDGRLIGWPECKEHIPLDFSKVRFPGAYPNDNGVNIQHDDFFGQPQPETRRLLDLLRREGADLTLNWHTGAPLENYYTRLHREFIHPSLDLHFREIYRRIHTRLTKEGLQSTNDVELEADPDLAPIGTFNLDTAINLHSGALPILIEQACHGRSGTNRNGEVVEPDLDRILDEGLYTNIEAMRYLVETGGRIKWTPKGWFDFQSNKSKL